MNLQIKEYIKDFYEKSNGVLGYRQVSITINREKTDELPHTIHVKRVRRIMRIRGLKSVIRRKRPDHIKSTSEMNGENIPNRDFKATVPFEKWLTDVTAFKYYVGSEVKKLYLSAIPDLYDRRIIAYKIGAGSRLFQGIFPLLWFKNLVWRGFKSLHETAENIFF